MGDEDIFCQQGLTTDKAGGWLWNSDAAGVQC